MWYNETRGGQMLGENIKKARKAAKLTQMQLGEKLGYKGRVAEVLIQNWEHDRRDPSVEMLRPLCEALNITLDELIPKTKRGE